MKNLILAFTGLLIALAIVLVLRYELTIDSPVVAKMDRLTGEVWIASSGEWRKVAHDGMKGTIAPRKP